MPSGSEAFRVGVMPMQAEKSPPPARSKKLLTISPIKGEVFGNFTRRSPCS